MKPVRRTPTLDVPGIRASLRFYEALGFALQKRWDGGAGRASDA